MSHWQRVEEEHHRLANGRMVTFARCGCTACWEHTQQRWLLEADDCRPLSPEEREEAWELMLRVRPSAGWSRTAPLRTCGCAPKVSDRYHICAF